MGDLLENLIAIISVLMRREGTEELQITDMELQEMSAAHFGKQLSFEVHAGVMTVKLDAAEAEAPEGAIEINDFIDALRGH